jgi:tRNA threonylcarbamoyladenosine biosynthesis protein TsaB
VRILAVDTTTERGSVAVVDSGQLLAELRLQGDGTHSQRLLPAIDFLLTGLGSTLEAVDGYAVTTGPGSFTGLRIGISTIQGLALGHPRPCLGVSALDVLAARMRGAAQTLAAMMDAWRDEVYAALYDGEARPRSGPFVEAPARFLERVPAGAAFLGSGVDRYREIVRTRDPGARFPERSLFLAGTLGRLAEPRLSRGEGGDPARLRPLYVREADALKPRR